MATFLEQLKRFTVVVADTGDFESIKAFKPRDSTTNPSLIAAAAWQPQYRDLVKKAAGEAMGKVSELSNKAIAHYTVEQLAIELGIQLLEMVPGRVSTEVDARLSYDTEASIAKAHELMKMYEERGVSRERVLIKLASTWQGIKAAEVLEREGIHCNLTLLFGLHQAAACAEAKVTLVSPFVGRILDWYLKDTGRDSFPPPEDPGVLSVSRIYNYFKRHGYGTEVMGASFRNVGEVIELAGCDLLTISPKLLSELDGLSGTLQRKLEPEAAKRLGAEKLKVDKLTFDRMHGEDKMANDKLKEGIEGFIKAAVDLEHAIEERL